MKDFWDDDEVSHEDVARGTANREKVLAELIDHALTSKPLDADRVAKWHKDCLAGLSYVKGFEAWLGAYRGSDGDDELKEMRVGVDKTEGTLPHEVAHALDAFFTELRERMRALMSVIDADKDKTREQLRRIAELAGWAHGEWVRIHPFANANGRTARLIANWILVRFRLLPVVGIRPRPDHPYGPAAVASMRGDHRKITNFILHLLENPPAGG
ncbi:MAG TPA: Fic family protein [Burkholderiales bacterium]|nr:Fic family protein [Burkholderiales bacterium]